MKTCLIKDTYIIEIKNEVILIYKKIIYLIAGAFQPIFVYHLICSHQKLFPMKWVYDRHYDSFKEILDPLNQMYPTTDGEKATILFWDILVLVVCMAAVLMVAMLAKSQSGGLSKAQRIIAVTGGLAATGLFLWMKLGEVETLLYMKFIVPEIILITACAVAITGGRNRE